MDDRVALPKRDDAMGWLMDYHDCLVGDHGDYWKTTAGEALMVLSPGNGRWYAWRSIRERGGL
jgi:hypothetical protein